jgi:hypothetical protein
LNAKKKRERKASDDALEKSTTPPNTRQAQSPSSQKLQRERERERERKTVEETSLSLSLSLFGYFHTRIYYSDDVKTKERKKERENVVLAPP